MTAWFVVNPNAGKVRYRPLVDSIRRKLARASDTVAAELPDPGRFGRHLVVAVGGDGTANRVINHCDPSSLRLGLIPRGSANDLASELGIPEDIGRALQLIEEPSVRRIDLIQVNGARFATCGGFGLLTGVATRANRWKATPGWRSRLARAGGPLVYVVATLLELRNAAPIPATIECDGDVRQVSLMLAVVSNQPRFGGRFSCSPSASNRDGMLHLFGIEAPCGTPRLLWLCTRIFSGSCGGIRGTFQVRARTLRVRTGRDVGFCADGEPLASGREFHLEVLPRALEVVAPPSRQLREEGESA